MTDDEEHDCDCYTDMEELKENLDLPECEYDNHVYGAGYSGEPDDHPRMKEMKDQVDEHGEVHAVVEEHDRELEVRQGMAVFDFDRGLIRFFGDENKESPTVMFDSIIDWYKPKSVWE